MDNYRIKTWIEDQIGAIGIRRILVDTTIKRLKPKMSYKD